MRIENCLNPQLLRVSPFLLVLATVWIVSGELPNGTVTGKYFWFYGVIVFVSATVFIYCLFDRRTLRFSLPDFFVLLFCVSGLAVTWFHNNSLSNKWVILLLTLPLYFCFRYMLQDNRKGRDFLLFFLLITGLIEAWWGLAQLYGVRRSFHNLYPVTGSFFNPGPYAGYLAMIAPIAVYYCLCDTRVFQRSRNGRFLPFYIRGGLSMLTLTSILVILPSTMSRAAWIAAICGSVWVFVMYYHKNRKPKKNLKNVSRLIAGNRKYIFIFIVCTLLSGVYYLKKDSADGRFLIWKISSQVIARHPFGVGLGNFAGSYGEQQAAYFASGAGSDQERQVAGSPDYGFNEYLQIGVEYGILGLLLFTAIICRAIYTGIKIKRYAVVGSLGALLIFAFMSYPFSILPFVIVFVFLLASCGTDIKPAVSKKSTGRYATVGWFGLLLAITVVGSYSRISTYHAYKKMNTAFFLKINGLRKDVLSVYEEIYHELNHETHFLFDYANMLKNAGEYAKSNRVLQQGMKISCDPVFYNLTGINYQLMKNYTAAESYFMKSTHVVPNRLYPHYLLMKLYIETGDEEKAREAAAIVLTKEPKVQSTAVREMREEARKLTIEN